MPIKSTLPLPNIKTHMFQGTDCNWCDCWSGMLDQLASLIAGNWNGVWDVDLDGVLYQGGTKAYFFKGNDYRRYDLESD